MVSPPAQVMKQADETIVGSTAMGMVYGVARRSLSLPVRIVPLSKVRASPDLALQASGTLRARATSKHLPASCSLPAAVHAAFPCSSRALLQQPGQLLQLALCLPPQA